MTKKKGAAADDKERVVLDATAAKGDLKPIGGSMSDDFNHILYNQVCSALWTAHSDAEARKVQTMGAAMAMVGIRPKDEIEGMMVAQLVAAHNASMECYRRAMIKEQTFEGRRENLNQANKLSRTYATLVEVLNRHRGKGQQEVTVEHVHVHAGGQAVVGNVEAGGGAKTKIEEQSHAQIAHAHEPAMWGQDESRDAMPVARDCERSMPDARRD
ncbi:hypothetical protein LMG27198_01120 [Methylocystis echinoides]|uniref:Uncharacterized protein n=1 Tax=Methylocystis echinoides TaxID=29468 RepID=A0A9W6GQN0_9HYPH|nr:hypothetical protein LMG27198_01120 [Methylocystis echinoides]